jgi:hypothetical protein
VADDPAVLAHAGGFDDLRGLLELPQVVGGGEVLVREDRRPAHLRQGRGPLPGLDVLLAFKSPDGAVDEHGREAAHGGEEQAGEEDRGLELEGHSLEV